MDDVSVFFDDHNDFYDTGVMELDHLFLEFIKKTEKTRFNLLDIGGGNGNFANFVLNSFPESNITIIDPSTTLLNMVDDPRINKINGKFPDDLKVSSTFDFIHIRNVLHHITGDSVKGSIKLLKESLNSINEFLDENGFLLVQESCNEGYLIPKLLRYLIFYIFKLQNKLNLDIPVDEFRKGLQACFYTRKELETILDDSGFEVIKKDVVDQNIRRNSRKLLLIKDSLQFSFICQRR